MQGILVVRINEDFSQRSMIGSGDNDVDPKGFLNVDERLIPSCLQSRALARATYPKLQSPALALS